MNLQKALRNLGLEGLVYGAVGIFAFLYGFLDFLPFLNLTDDVVVRLLISVTGLVLTSITTLMIRRAEDISELRDSLGEAEIELLDMKVGFPQHIANSASKAQRFILDTNLNAEIPRLNASSPQKAYREIREKKLREDKIAFRQVVSIFHKGNLKSLIELLLTYYRTDNYLRHYDSPPTAIPMIHMMSFDNDQFYIGGFYPAEAPTEEHALYIRHPKATKLFRDYWDVLWQKGIPLNSGKEIYWDELQRIGNRVGLSDTEFDQMVTEIKEQIGFIE